MPENDKVKADTESKAMLEASQRMIERTKDKVSRLKEDIELQEALLAKQRDELNKLLDDLGIEHTQSPAPQD